MQATPYGTSVKGFRDASPRFVRIDPLLLLATLGLMACSVYTIASATTDDIPGDPNYYVTRQAAYAGVGLVLMLAAVADRLLAPARVDASACTAS